MVRFKVDESLPGSLAEAIGSVGHEAVHIRDASLQGASDKAVFEHAQSQQAILVTTDLEFGDMRNFPLGAHAGVILLRMPRVVTTARLAEEQVRVLRELSDSDLKGNLLIVEPRQVRIRRPDA